MEDIQKEAHNFWHVRVNSCDMEPDYACDHEIPRLHRSYANCIVLSIKPTVLRKSLRYVWTFP